MDKPTEAQVKEFWEWCGFKWWSNGDCWCFGESGIFRDLLPIDLNNLFKYAVPFLQDKGYQIDIVCFEHKGYDVSVFNTIKDIEDFEGAKGNDLALALFWALWKVKEAKDD